MSICPENDIHSVYLDGELNSPYKEQYLEHLQNCASCTEKLNKLKSVQGILREDSKNISLSDEQLAESYQKLSTLLKFRNVTKKSTNSPLVFLNKVIPAMAAALIIAVVLPIRLISGGISQQDLSFVSQNTNIPKLFTERGIIADDAVYYGCDGFDGLAGQFEDFSVIPQEVSMLSHFDSNATEGMAADYIAKYTENFGTDTLNQFGASAYDCVYAIYNAMKAAIDAGETIDVTISASDLCEILKAQFNGGFSYSGVTGENITWDENGYVAKIAVKYTLKEAN